VENGETGIDADLTIMLLISGYELLPIIWKAVLWVEFMSTAISESQKAPVSAKKMINDLDQNDWARLEEVDEDGEPTMMYHHDMEDNTEVRVVKKTLD
jgi:hypothetical protein